MKEQLILRCEDTLDGIFTAIFDGFVYKNRESQPYEDQIRIAVGEEGNLQLFAKEITVETDSQKAAKTVYAIRTRLGQYIYQRVFYALCHYEEERASVVFGYLVRAFRFGIRIDEHLADSYVMRVMELSRKVSNECQKLYGFLRFRQLDQLLYAEFEPKCNAIPVMMEHFEDRYPNENFLIYDKKRKYALVHPAYKASFFVQEEEMPDMNADERDEFEELWKRYFVTMEIKDRHNEACQGNLLPKWYRKEMLEFQ